MLQHTRIFAAHAGVPAHEHSSVRSGAPVMTAAHSSCALEALAPTASVLKNAILLLFV
jgi:hypothetical protein